MIATNPSSCGDTALVVITNDPQLCIVSLVEKIVISPNPVSDKLTVQVIRKASAKVDIILHNAAGQLMYSATSQQPAGSQSYIIPMKPMAGGIYFVTVRVNDKKEVVKRIMNR